MANPKVLNVERPASFTLRRDGEEAYANDQADFLVVTVDHNSDGYRVYQLVLPFANFTGLQGEWEAGESTTVLKAAIVASFVDPGPPADHLTVAQRADVVGFEIVVA